LYAVFRPATFLVAKSECLVARVFWIRSIRLGASGQRLLLRMSCPQKKNFGAQRATAYWQSAGKLLGATNLLFWLPVIPP
tara:strand:+ start:501 stop:740 length:240 start_codon:yes stop_codon:yes gene_type:complete